MQESWTIAELAELAAETLAATDPAGPPSGPARTDGRIRDVPNERLIRWYATVGLVDPPLSRRGRVALYGRRHLLQLVAVKRRQAQGRSLAEIQAELAGATDKQLEAIAQVPAHPSGVEQDHGGGAGPGRMDVTPPARFWARSATQPPAGQPPAGQPPAGLGPRPEPAGWPDGHPAG